MSKPFKRSLHVFRRDLRIDDNTALNAAAEQSESVLCCFILDPRQIEEHPYRSRHALQFMGESLRELAQDVAKQGGRLEILKGEAHGVIEQILQQERIEAVFMNRDYTPFARNRDRAIHERCERLGVSAHLFSDALLQEPEAVSKNEGGPYTVYTPFMKKAATLPVTKPRAWGAKPLSRFARPSEGTDLLASLDVTPSEQNFARGGRSHGLALLEDIGERFSDYKETRDVPALEATTGLSAHHKFGTVSVRETYHRVAQAFGTDHTLIRELYWRDFYTHIAFHFPRVFRESFITTLNDLAWENNEQWFKAWCEGMTGFPIVDAGMRQLNQTGFMHNRVRMIVASFLTKDLLIDWRWGERYFATRLVDYDPAVNNGSWQWAASTGCDAQPYFRIFNPWLQQQRFDPDCLYVKRWVPELRDIEAKALHALHEESIEPECYPRPIVDHAEQKSKALKMFAGSGKG